MRPPRPSACGRFAVLDELHLDLALVEALARLAQDAGVTMQDAIQLAICALVERVDPSAPHAPHEAAAAAPAPVDPAPG